MSAPDMTDTDAAFLDDMAERWRTCRDGPGWLGTERHITRLFALARLGAAKASFAAELAKLQAEIEALRTTLHQRQEDLRKFDQPDKLELELRIIDHAIAALGGVP